MDSINEVSRGSELAYLQVDVDQQRRRCAPTHWATCGMFTHRVGVAGVLGVAGDALAQRDAVPDGDLLGPVWTSLTSSRSTRRRSPRVEVSALVCR